MRSPLLSVFAVGAFICGHASAQSHAKAATSQPQTTQAAVSKTAPKAAFYGAGTRRQDLLPNTQRVLLWRLNGLGISEGIRRSLETLVLSHLRQMPHKDVVAPEVLRQKLLEPDFAHLNTCYEGPDCLRQRGAAVAADIVIYGTISALGDDYSLNLRALKVADGLELGRRTAFLSGNLDELIPQMRLVSFALLAPEAICGSLMIDTALSGIAVQVDGVRQPPTPWSAPLEHLKPGRHVVRFDGFQSTHSEVWVDIAPFEISQVQVELGKGSVAGKQSQSSRQSANPDAAGLVAPAEP